MTALDAGVGSAGDDCEFVADVLERFEVGRWGVGVAFVLGDEVGVVQSEGKRDADEAFGICGGGRGEGGGHGVEQGQAEGDAGLFEDGAAGERLAGGDVHVRRSLFGEESGAGESVEDQGAEAVVFGLGLFENRGEVRAIAEADFSTGTVAQNLFYESAGEDFLLF